MAILGVEAQAQRDSGRRTLAKAKIRVDMGIPCSKLLALTILSLYAQTSKRILLGMTRMSKVAAILARTDGWR